MGSTRVTNHLPGYTGFIPDIDINIKASLQSKGELTRKTYFKNNIVQNYNVKLPGFAGHMPASCLNDRGIIRPRCTSVDGESFK